MDSGLTLSFPSSRSRAADQRWALSLGGPSGDFGVFH